MTTPRSFRKLYVKSYGCQMNVYDSQRMADTLAPLGFVETSSPEEADLIVLNTCHIREKAAEKVYSELGRIRQLKERAARTDRRLTVAVAGCVAQAEGEEIIRRAPVVDIVVGPQNYHRLPALLARPYVRAIQFVPGAGQPPNGPLWLDTYRQIQAAGRIVWLQLPPDNIAPLARVLDPARVCFQTAVATEAEARELLSAARRWC